MIRAIYLASAMLGLAYSRVVNAGKVEDSLEFGLVSRQTVPPLPGVCLPRARTCSCCAFDVGTSPHSFSFENYDVPACSSKYIGDVKEPAKPSNRCPYVVLSSPGKSGTYIFNANSGASCTLTSSQRDQTFGTKWKSLEPTGSKVTFKAYNGDFTFKEFRIYIATIPAGVFNKVANPVCRVTLTASGPCDGQVLRTKTYDLFPKTRPQVSFIRTDGSFAAINKLDVKVEWPHVLGPFLAWFFIDDFWFEI